MIKQDRQDPCHVVQHRWVLAMTCGRVRGVLTPVSLVTVSEMYLCAALMQVHTYTHKHTRTHILSPSLSLSLTLPLSLSLACLYTYVYIGRLSIM